MKNLILASLGALWCLVLGGCSGARIYSVDIVNDSDRTVRMEVREGKGDEADKALVSKVCGAAERLTWSGEGGPTVYFRATMLQHDQPTGQPRDLALAEGGTTAGSVGIAEGQLVIKGVAVRRPRSERPEDIVPPPDRLRSGQHIR